MQLDWDGYFWIKGDRFSLFIMTGMLFLNEISNSGKAKEIHDEKLPELHSESGHHL